MQKVIEIFFPEEIKIIVESHGIQLKTFFSSLSSWKKEENKRFFAQKMEGEYLQGCQSRSHTNVKGKMTRWY